MRRVSREAHGPEVSVDCGEPSETGEDASGDRYIVVDAVDERGIEHGIAETLHAMSCFARRVAQPFIALALFSAACSLP